MEKSNRTKKEPFLWTSKRNKKQARKNGSSQFKIPATAVAGHLISKRLDRFATMKEPKRDQLNPPGDYF